jgi:hypothetical protein
MALQNQPMFQQAMLKANAKGSMRGNRPKTKGIQSRLAEMDLARKAAFRDIGLTRKRSDLSHRGRMAGHQVAQDELSQRQDQLPWQIGIGAGVGLISGLEGRRRARMIREGRDLEQQRFDGLMANNSGRMAAANTRFGLPTSGRR